MVNWIRDTERLHK